jgi:hypothetical protein
MANSQRFWGIMRTHRENEYSSLCTKIYLYPPIRRRDALSRKDKMGGFGYDYAIIEILTETGSEPKMGFGPADENEDFY